MAAKSKKRLSKIDNKLLKLEKLELKDVICSICQSILIEPVTLPCYHYFCHHCFNGSIENNALCCPLCRLRIGSWLRTATKQKNIINIELWKHIKSKFSREIDVKLRGEDINIPQEEPVLRLSAPGEIRSEYEAEVQRLNAERLQLEQKQFNETENLIKKIHQEEKDAQKKYLEKIKQDEILAHQIQKDHLKDSTSSRKLNLGDRTTKPRLKTTKIDNYLSKTQAPAAKDSPLLTDDNTSSEASGMGTPKAATVKPNSRPSPEMVPSYGKLLKSFIDKKIKSGASFWNKENGDQDKKEDPQPSYKEIDKVEENTGKAKNGIKSLLVSLPLPHSGIPKYPSKKLRVPESKILRMDSVDSMHQELCYFKPIESTTPINANKCKSVPVRVPCVRAPAERPPRGEAAPSRAQYVESLSRLRSLSLARNLPSAFVIALNILKTKKENSTKCAANTSRIKKSSAHVETLPEKKTTSIKSKQTKKVNGITKLDYDTSLRRTRSMGSLKDENETTPKKAKTHERKATSERKPYLRSKSKKSNAKKRLSSPALISENHNNHKVNLAVKNLSSPLENCDVKKIILQEQLRIEKLIEQEKSDFEMARQIDAEWNGRRQLRRAAAKRQVTLNYALRPSKKLKV